MTGAVADMNLMPPQCVRRKANTGAWGKPLVRHTHTTQRERGPKAENRFFIGGEKIIATG
jgi:hypothetical protein